MPRFFNSTYSPFWDYQHKTLRARLSAIVGGFDKDVLERFYALTPDQLTHLINIYSHEYGEGPAAYARKTYDDWKRGTVRPSAQTISRLLDNLPLVLNFEGKCELLRKLPGGAEWIKSQTTARNWCAKPITACSNQVQKISSMTSLPISTTNKLRK